MTALPAKYAYVAAPDAPDTIKQALKMYGTTEVPGNGNNQIILNWATEVEKATGLPHLGYTADEIPWCGLFAALVCVRAGYADQINKTPLWAPSWITFGNPVLTPSFGDIMVFSRNGGGHVSFYVGEDENYYHILGGNQSDQVDIMMEPKSKFTGARRPRFKLNVQPLSVRKIIVGASGAPAAPTQVSEYQRNVFVQQRLNELGHKPPLFIDGKIGRLTTAAVTAFQKANGLEVDGIVGPQTLAALKSPSAYPVGVADIGADQPDLSSPASRGIDMLTGFKTLIASAIVAIGPTALSWFGGVDVVHTLGLSPTAGLIVGGIMAVLRFMTKTPVATSTI